MTKAFIELVNIYDFSIPLILFNLLLMSLERTEISI